MSSSQEAAADSPIWLFRKRLDKLDANVALRQLKVEECSEAMKGVLARERRYHYVRVMATDPNGAVYQLRFMKYDGGAHLLFHQWGHVVAANRLKRGDTVEGWGNLVCDGAGEIYITCALHIRRRKSSRKSPSSGNQDPERKRKTPDGKNPKKKKENPAERKYSPSSEKSKSVGGNEKIGSGVIPSERNRLNSSPAIQESEKVDIADGENPETKKGLTKKAVILFEKELLIDQCFALCNGWEKIATENGLKNGDASSHGTFKVLLYLLRKLAMKNDDEEMKLAIEQVMKKNVEIKGRKEEKV